MRAFIAIDLPEKLKANLAKLQESLNTGNLGFNWVKPDKVHLTLKFLGNIDEDQLPEIEKTITQTTSQTKAFELTTEGFGFFPNQKKPRVFFISLKNPEQLESLVKKLEKALAPLGFLNEKQTCLPPACRQAGQGRFKPHITLARIKNQENIEILVEKIKKIELKEKFPAREITLYKSTLTSSRPIYEIISSSPLTN